LRFLFSDDVVTMGEVASVVVVVVATGSFVIDSIFTSCLLYQSFHLAWLLV